MASKKGCYPSGKKANGRLRKGFKWRRGRKDCPVPAKGQKKSRRRGPGAFAPTRRMSQASTRRMSQAPTFLL